MLSFASFLSKSVMRETISSVPLMEIRIDALQEVHVSYLPETIYRQHEQVDCWVDGGGGTVISHARVRIMAENKGIWLAVNCIWQGNQNAVKSNDTAKASVRKELTPLARWQADV